jgi:hypothetical protein
MTLYIQHPFQTYFDPSKITLNIQHSLGDAIGGLGCNLFIVNCFSPSYHLLVTQFIVNKVLIFCVNDVYPWGIALESHFSHFDIQIASKDKGHGLTPYFVL